MGRKRKPKRHPGFHTIARQIARRQHLSIARASAILAARTRHSSSIAKRRNPRLRRVHGKGILSTLLNPAKLLNIKR